MDLVKFITTFFLAKKTTLVTAFLCWSTDKTVSLWHGAAEAGIRLKVLADLSSAPEIAAYDVYREGILLDVDCPDADIVLQKASSSRAFIHRFSWLLVTKSTLNDSSIERILADVAILPDADVVWSSIDVIVDVYKIKQGQPILRTPLALDNNSSLQDMETVLSLWPTPVERRRNLRSVYLKSATIISQPQYFKGWSDLSNRQIDTYPKLTYPLLMLLAEDLNFRHNLKQVDLYGEERNGSFDGLAGLLQRAEVELGVTSMFMRADRMRVVHFCSETVELKGAFLFRQPAQSAVSNVFLLPFSRGVWAALGGVVALAATLLAALSHRLAPAHPALRQITLADSFTFAVGTVCQQGFYMSPEVLSVRAVMFSALVCSVFAFTAYSAKVVAILQTPSDAIQTIDDLARSPIALGVQETTYKRVYFAESKEPATQRLYRRKLMPLGERAYLSVVDGVARLRTDFFAFQVEQSSGYDIISKTFTEREKCGLKEIQAFKLPMVAVPIRRHAGYRDLFAARLRWQREVGLMSSWRRRWLAARPRCDAGAGGFDSVGLADVLPALHVLAAGALGAALLLAAELAARTAAARGLAYSLLLVKVF